MTVVRRRALVLEEPFCTGCSGYTGWGACSDLRRRRHQHGVLPAQERCTLWVCQGCQKPSRIVYAKLVGTMCSWPECTAQEGLISVEGLDGQERSHCGQHHVAVTRLLAAARPPQPPVERRRTKPRSRRAS